MSNMDANVSSSDGGSFASSLQAPSFSLLGRSDQILICQSWKEPQHIIFQLANMFFISGFLAPDNKYGALYLHTLLMVAFLFTTAWAWNVLCTPDLFFYSFAAMIINMAQTIYLLFTLRQVKFPRELEDIYEVLFEPMRVPRMLFKRLVSLEYAQVLNLHAGEAYAMQNLTRTDRLALLIAGKVSVLSDHHFLHHIHPREFLDSPEFESTRSGKEDKYKVTIIAVTPCRYILWQRQNLEYLLVKENFLATIFALLLERDITSKLYAMNEKIVTEKGEHLDIRLPSVTGSMTYQVTSAHENKQSVHRGNKGHMHLYINMKHRLFHTFTMCVTVEYMAMAVVLHKRTDPLLLTPYIKANQTETARRLARIKDLPGASPVLNEMIRSYSGFITVNEVCQSNLFFWFFPQLRNEKTTSDNKNQYNISTPLILWMQGGPGASSLFGLFVESGPFQVNMDLTLTLRKSSWLQHASLLYLDNPVGSGFSFTSDEDCYPTDQFAIADDLTSFIQQFYTLFPEFVTTPLYIGGQSYAGKYVPTLSYRLATDETFSYVPLQGMIIGNGFSDPIHMLEYADFLEGVGLINRQQADDIQKQTKVARKMIELKKYVDAYAIIDQLIVGAFTPQGTTIQNLTGIGHYYNILRSGHPPEMTFFYHYLHMERVKKSIHVGGRNISDGSAIRRALIADMMQSVADQFAKLLDSGYRVLFYSGQLDIIVNYVCVENFFYNLKWSGSDKWKRSKRKQWRIDGPQVVGFVRQVDNLTEVMIRNAGHIAPFDQPWPTLDMLRRFINRLQFS